LLLTPTGRIRADVQVLRRVEDVLLVQDPGQPDPIDTLLAPYLLSASVTLEDATGRFAVFALPDAGIAPAALQSCRPSCLGPGCDIVSPRTAAGSTAAELVEAGFAEVGGEAAEAWRIVRGVARMGAEFDQRSLPAEAGLEHLIDTTKGCFLGQESVARIRNLGHPPRVLRHVRGVHELPTDARVLVDGASIGTLTSATSTGDGWIGFAQVVWAAATARLTDIDGHPLVDLGAAG
jgi:folate-binding protein YgfZ